MAAMLLEKGAVINMPGFDHDTPLHDAVTNKRQECAKLLVARGASVSARFATFRHHFILSFVFFFSHRNIYGKTPLDLAATPEMKKILTGTQVDPGLASQTQKVVHCVVTKY
jgi:ankyrin repeat protein